MNLTMKIIAAAAFRCRLKSKKKKKKARVISYDNYRLDNYTSTKCAAQLLWKHRTDLTFPNEWQSAH